MASGDTVYLLDDDLEHVLTTAGFQRLTILGQPLSLLESLAAAGRAKSQSFGVIGALARALGADANGMTRQFDVAMAAIQAHTVAATEVAGGPAAFEPVPNGTYWVWATHYDYVNTGAQGTVSGGVVTVTPTGYDRVTMWNVKTTLVSGANRLTLSAANASLKGQ